MTRLGRHGLQVLGVTRIAYGAYVLAKPGPGAVSWLGVAGQGPGPEVLMRSVGARDAAIGVALASGKGSPVAIARGAVVLDLADLVATVAARDRLPRSQILKAAGVIAIYATVTTALIARAQRA